MRRWFQLAMVLACGGVLAAAPPPEPARRDLTVLVVVGAGGADEYEARFHKEAATLDEACRKAGVACTLLGAGKTGGEGNDLAALKSNIERIVAEKKPSLWLVLIGHGTFDGREAKFNLRGPDLTAADLASWLKPYEGDLAVINTAPASAPFLKALAGPKRVVIAATKSADEVFATRFGGYFVKAITGDLEADLDGDRQVSLLESFLWASRQVARFYENESRLATEHAVIEDGGDGAGVRADAFEGLRLSKKATEAKRSGGQLARQWFLLLNGEEAALSEETRRRRDALEREAEDIRGRKDSMKPEDYYRELEKVFLEIARLSREAGGAGSR